MWSIRSLHFGRADQSSHPRREIFKILLPEQQQHFIKCD